MWPQVLLSGVRIQVTRVNFIFVSTLRMVVSGMPSNSLLKSGYPISKFKIRNRTQALFKEYLVLGPATGDKSNLQCKQDQPADAHELISREPFTSYQQTKQHHNQGIARSNG